MNKKFLILVVIGLIIPQITLAAWWNPFTWRVFNRENKTQILENQVKELEKKLDTKATSTPASYEQVITEQKAKATQINTQINKSSIPKTYEQTTKEAQTRATEIRKQITPTPIEAIKTWSLPNGTVIDEYGNIISQQVQKNNNTIVNLPNGSIVEMDSHGNIVRYIKEIQVIASSATIENNFVTIKELKGSYYLNNRGPEFYYTVENKSGVEAHIARLNLRLDGYGYSPETQSKLYIYLQNNSGKTLGSTVIQPDVKDSKTPFSISISLDLDTPLVVYEKSSINFRIGFYSTPDEQIASVITVATLVNLGFSGVSSGSFNFEGLPLVIYPQQKQVGGAPENF